ncbi:rRNA-processing protein las1 [Tilletia horrida]|uniref:rRNA-processing protein las1 n=1 Tax=Tilletia horrida TaxID=155126 RepID=A0AAN6GWF3_9BASI|nr:rRNA-processing protein las1 [Tilletia horrida]
MTSRLSLNLAIVRFVNSLVDSHQTGMFAAPVKTIAMRLGLPLWLVELRHAGTHDELPSLESLRTASEIALRWLDINFWIPSITEAERSMRGTDSTRPERTDFSTPASTGFESAIDLMRYRIEEAEKRKHLAATSSDQSDSGATHPPRLPRGWRLASSDWKPSPIGYVDGRIPDLNL